MSEETCTGGCHCGKVRFEASMELSKVMECNCSICSRKGFLLTFVTADRFTLLGGEAELTEYRFANQRVRHRFCSICGIQAFCMGQKPDGTAVVGINVRCLDGIELAGLTVVPVDGRSL
jgi:hypothetical protein